MEHDPSYDGKKYTEFVTSRPVLQKNAKVLQATGNDTRSSSRKSIRNGKYADIYIKDLFFSLKTYKIRAEIITYYRAYNEYRLVCMTT